MKQLKAWILAEKAAVLRLEKAGKLAPKTARGKLRRLGVKA